MLALSPRVVEPLFEQFQALIPPRPPDTHPRGGHRRRIPDRICFQGILVRLVTGCSWDVAARLVGVGETTLRRRRDEWVRAGVFGRLAELALGAYDRVVGLDLTEVTIDGSQHKAPGGGPGTGPNGTDRGKLGWKWSLATDAWGIPIAWTIEAANRHDSKLLDETLFALEARGYEVEIEGMLLDRGYDYHHVRAELAEAGIEAEIPVRPPSIHGERRRRRSRVALGRRWRVERASSWLTNFGQLRRNTDRKAVHREAALDLAVAAILTVKLVKWHERYGSVLAA